MMRYDSDVNVVDCSSDHSRVVEPLLNPAYNRMSFVLLP